MVNLFYMTDFLSFFSILLFPYLRIALLLCTRLSIISFESGEYQPGSTVLREAAKVHF